MFRKRPKGYYLPPSDGVLIRDVSTETTVKNGVEVTKEKVSLLTEKEFLRKHPVPNAEYSLAEMLRSGVSLKDVPCTHLLDKTDVLDTPLANMSDEELLSNLNESENE